MTREQIQVGVQADEVTLSGEQPPRAVSCDHVLQIEREHGRELLLMRPAKASTGTVENRVDAIGTSGAPTIGTSGANRAPDSIEESNRESNSCCLARAQARRGAGATPKGEP
jgi:hypothetical protein